ncbi:MAG TPA: type II toxin-antitoxin system RelE/ParE family toxin [Rhodanobacteraceae bacterium]|nr:type II toxin-antitoxin system RelE/ParE family toxin [Rhodanobacteraceae bacterium]
MTWRIEFDPAAAKELRKLGAIPARRLAEFLSKRIATLDDPSSLGEALKGRLGELWKYRVGDYRIIADIQDRVVLILVVRIGHRREICKR